MSVIKATVSIALPGSVMYEENVCQSDKSLYDFNSVWVEDRSAKDKKRDKINFYTRQCKPATQVLNINDEAYSYMVSSDTPSFSNRGAWNKMNKNQRLEAHFNEIAKSLGGTVINFSVFPD